MKTIDGRGLECPKPVLLTKEAVDGGERELDVLVDNEVAVGNVTRFLENSGFTVTKKDESAGDSKVYRLHGAGGEHVKTGAPAEVNRTFLITSDTIGDASDGLGEVLMKGFLGTIKSHSQLPTVIALMNSAVKLALPGPTAETLSELASLGVKILVCGTCTKHFDITDKIAVGVISNMFEITEAVYGAAKPILVR